jgi:small-conductance mechanosensitive channel
MNRLRYVALILVLATMLLAACGGAAPSATLPPATPTLSFLAPENDTSAASPTSLLGDILVTRTPEPTATPGVVEQAVEEVTAETGLAYVYFLGLATSDWINLGISFVFVLVGYLLGTLLIHRVLPPLARRTPTDLDDRLLDKTGPDLRWLVVMFVLHFATRRLTFVSAEAKDVLSDLYFVAGLLIGLHGLWGLIDLAGQWYGERAARAGRTEQLAPIIILLVRMARIALVVIGFSILLSHLGINVTAFAATLGLGGLALSLGARDTIADAIAGFIILVDRPFRIGDRIAIQGEGTWGDVVEIGLRTTRIRTRDNRMVIVPNSLINQNQVTNYTYPDPRYRIETTVGIAYGTDIEVVERLIIDAVRQVTGVLSDKEVEVLYDKMGDWAMTLCVRWWIESYADAKRMHDRVHRTLEKTLDEAGIEMPYPTQTLHVLDKPYMADSNTD